MAVYSGIVDIRRDLPSDLSEAQLNDALAQFWFYWTTTPELLLCTMAQKRAITKFCGTYPLKRSFMDRLLRRVRYSDGTVKWAGYNYQNEIKKYESDVGSVEIRVER